MVRGPAPDELSRPWLGEGDHGIWLAHNAWSLLAVAVWRQQVTGTPVDVWVPEYFPEQTVAQLRKNGFSLSFYPIVESFEPDWSACKSLARGKPPRIFVLAHHFGRPADAPRARRFCDEHHGLLVEDAGHVLRPSSGVGEHGEFVLYSPHELVGVPDGALLVARLASAGLASIGRDTVIASLEAAVRGLGSTTPWFWPWRAAERPPASPRFRCVAVPRATRWLTWARS